MRAIQAFFVLMVLTSCAVLLQLYRQHSRQLPLTHRSLFDKSNLHDDNDATDNNSTGYSDDKIDSTTSLAAAAYSSRVDGETSRDRNNQFQITEISTSVSNDYKSTLLSNQGERQRILKAFCSGKKTYYRKSHRHVVYNKKLKFAYCKVGKVASSAWSGLLKKACGDYSRGSQSKRLPELRGSGENLFKFMFVRHPFDRILSAYKSKFLSPRSSYLKKLAPKIIRKFRKHNSSSSSSEVTFEEFVAYLVNPKRSGTLQDFHWSPQIEICPPCGRLRYDFIGHYETLYDDADYILTKIGIKTRFSTSYASKLADWAKRIQAAYSQIPADYRNRLKRLYMLDFRAFGYDPDII